MGQYQEAKKVALSYFDALEKAEPEQVLQVFREYMTEDYNWKGVYPFREQNGREAVAESFWIPLKKGLSLHDLHVHIVHCMEFTGRSMEILF